MKNTIENKAKFFALYYGQKVAKSELHNDKLPCCKSFAELALKPENNFFLDLKPLSQISDEDAVEVANVLNGRNIKKSELREDWKEIITTYDVYGLADVSDYLRSKGYLIPFMGLSTEKIIEYGWVQIKS